MLPQESKMLSRYIHLIHRFFSPGCQHLLGTNVNSDGLQSEVKRRPASVTLLGTAEHFQNLGAVHHLSGAHIMQTAVL